MASYRFLSTWLLDCPREPVWDAIYDQERWPEWWRGVVAAEEIKPGDENGVGTISRLAWRSRLPYRLEFEVTTVRVEKPQLMEGRAVGELTGTGRWRLFEQGGVTAVIYEWNVTTSRAWMNLLAPIGRPIFDWNHNWVMARGGEGLARLLGCSLLAARVTRIGRWAGIAAAGAGLLIAVAVAAGLFDSGSSDAAGSEPRVRISGRGWFPPFAAGRRDYVTRCGSGSAQVSISAGRGTRVSVAGRRARSGRFVTELPRTGGQDFRIGAVAGDQQRTYEVRCLPPGFPSWRYQRLRPGPAGLFTVAFRAPGKEGAWIVIFDQAGMPRWWLRSRGRVLWAQVLRDGKIAWARAFGDGYGIDPRSAHEVHALTGELLYLVRTRGSITDGHELFELPNGDLLLDTYVPHAEVDLSAYGGPRRTTVVLPQIQQVDRRGRVVWRWDARGRISLREAGRWWPFLLNNPHPAPDGGDAYDAVHLNSIEPWGHDRLVIAARHTDAVYGFRRPSGRMLFKLGGVRTPESLQVIGDPYPPNELFGGPHDARVDDGGRLSVYDDGTHRGRPPRFVRYDLDLERRTATFVDQLTDPEVRGSHCCGSGRRFGDGWLVDWGNTHVITGFDRDGRIAFRLRLPAQSFRAVPVRSAETTAGGLARALEAVERRAGRSQSP